MNLKVSYRIITIILFIVLIIGCAPVTSNTIESPAVNVQQTFQVPGYPAPELLTAQQQPYPGATQVNVQLPPDPPLSAPEPEPGKASVSGAIYSFTTKIRVAGTYAYLTPALGPQKDQMPGVLIGPQTEKGDFAFHTDDRGNFELNNVPPGRYFIIVWAPMTWNEVQVSETNIKAFLVDLPADQKTVLGKLYIAWP